MKAAVQLFVNRRWRNSGSTDIFKVLYSGGHVTTKRSKALAGDKNSAACEPEDCHFWRFTLRLEQQ